MAFVTNAKLYLKKKLAASDTSFTADRDIGTTSGRIKFRDPNNLDSTYLEWVAFSGVVNNGDGTYTYTVITNGRNMSLTAIPSTGSATGKTFGAGTEGTLVAMHDQLLDPSGTVVFPSLSVGALTLTTSLKVPVFANAAARDVAIPSPTVGMECFLSDVNNYYDYKTGGWFLRSLVSVTGLRTGLTPNGVITTDSGGNEVVSSNVPGHSVTIGTYESGIVAGDPVGLIQDGLYKVLGEVTTSNNAGTSATTIWGMEKLSSTRYAIMYNVGGTMYVVVATYTAATDVITYGTPVIVGSSGTGLSGGMALIGTDKLGFAYTDTSTAVNHSVYLIVGTVAGTVVSMGAATTWAVALGGSGNVTISKGVRIRNDAYGFSYNAGGFGAGFYGTTVSGTTVAQPTSIGGGYSETQSCYLQDNRIGIAYPTFNVATYNVLILEINPSSLAITTTYTSSIGLVANNNGTIARFSTTAVVCGGYDTINDANIYLFEIPGAGTTLTRNSIGTLSATNQKLIQIYDGIYGVDTGGTLIVMDMNQVIRTITLAVTTETSARPIYTNGRLIYNTGTNLQSRIIRLARAMYSGVAVNSTGTYNPRFAITQKTGVVFPYVYFLQTDGTVNRNSYTSGATRIGKAVATNYLLLE